MRRTRTLSDKLPSCPRLSLPVGLPHDAGCLSSVNDRFLNPHTDEVERKRLHGKKLQNAGGDCPVTPQVDRWDKLVCQTVYCAPYFWTVRCPQFGRWLDWMVAGCRVRLGGLPGVLGCPGLVGPGFGRHQVWFRNPSFGFCSWKSGAGLNLVFCNRRCKTCCARQRRPADGYHLLVA